MTVSVLIVGSFPFSKNWVYVILTGARYKRCEKPTMRPVELQSCSLLILLCLSSLVSPSLASIMDFVRNAFEHALSCFRLHPKFGSHCAKVHIARWAHGAERYVDRECCQALADFNRGRNELPNDKVRSRCAELGVKY